jgi:hypothetical protein
MHPAIPLLGAVLSIAATVHAQTPEVYEYTVEWRLIEAGRAKLTWTPAEVDGDHGHEANLHLESVGLVSRLYRVEDDYRALVANGFCTSSVSMRASEGRRRRQTNITFDRENAKLSYLERDLVKNTVVRQSELDVEKCTHDVMAALFALREMPPEPGKTIQLPITDGKKFVRGDIEAQERESVKTPAGTFKTIRYEAHLFNGKLYSRKARMFIWLSDDERKIPVQIRVRLGFAVGTITFQLTRHGTGAVPTHTGQ